MKERRFIAEMWCTSDDGITWLTEINGGDRHQVWVSAAAVHAQHQVSVEERLELLEEIKAGEEREAALRADLVRVRAGWDRALDLLAQANNLYARLRRAALAPVRSATVDPQLNRFSTDGRR